MLKCVRQILVTLTVHTSLLKYILFKYLIEQKRPNNLHLFIAFTIILMRKFSAYRLKLMEIKHLRIKKAIKNPLFYWVFFDFSKSLN